MRVPWILGVLLAASLAATAAAFAAAPATNETDVAAFANGAPIARSSSEYGSGWNALHLLDEDPRTGWAGVQGAKPPFEIVIALPERSEIRSLQFDSAHVERPGEAVKDIDIFLSEDSATSGFKPAGSVHGLTASDGQRFDLPAPAAGRYLKLVITANNGDDQYTEMMGVHAFGIELTHTPLPNVSGTYGSQKYGKFHLA